MADTHDYPLPTNANAANLVTVKLTEQNFLVWEAQFKSLALSQNVFGFLDGSVKKPPEEIEKECEGTKFMTSNPKFYAWLATDQLVKSWLFGTISEDFLDNVIGFDYAFEVWRSIQTHFKQNNVDRECDLFGQLYQCGRMSSNLQEYVRSFSRICNQLKVIGRPIEGGMRINLFLNGLGEKYEPCKTALFPVLRHLTFDDVVYQLQSYEARNLRYLNNSVDYNVAFVSQQIPDFRRGTVKSGTRGRGVAYSSKGRGFSQFNNRPIWQRQDDEQYLSTGGKVQLMKENAGLGSVICHHCGKRGHVMRNCWLLQSKIETGETSNVGMICQLCEKRGHKASKCRFRFDHSFEIDEEAEQKALVAIHAANNSYSDEWYPDTGATAHITNTPGQDERSNISTGNKGKWIVPDSIK